MEIETQSVYTSYSYNNAKFAVIYRPSQFEL